MPSSAPAADRSPDRIGAAVRFGASPRGGGERLADLGDVPVRAADRVGVRACRGSRSASRFVLRLLPAPLGPTASTRDDVGRIDHAGGDARARGSGSRCWRCSRARRCASRRQPLALLRAADRGARERRRSTGRGSRRRRTGPSRATDSSRWSAPASITSGVSASTSVYWPGLAVRQREEHDVVPREHLGRRLLQRQVRERAQVRLMLDEGLSRVRVRGDGADLDVGMCGEDPEDLAARIAGCAGDGDRICHGFHLRVWGRGLQTATPTAPLLGGCAGSPRVGGPSRRRRAGATLGTSVAERGAAEGMGRR